MSTKKKFDIKSTLSVPTRQLTPEQIDLATKSIHQVREQQQPSPAQHPKQSPEKKVPSTEKVATPKLEVNEPLEKYKSQKSGKKSEPAGKTPEQKKIRLSVDVLPAIHKKLKLKAVEHDTDIMHYVEMLIERDLGQ